MEYFPAKRSNLRDLQLILCVGCPVQHGLLDDDTQLVVDEQVRHILLGVVVQQHDALVVDGAGQALSEAGVLLQGIPVGTHLVILS